MSTKKRNIRSKEVLKLLNDGSLCIVFKISMAMKQTYCFLTFQHVKKARYGSLKMILSQQ